MTKSTAPSPVKTTRMFRLNEHITVELCPSGDVSLFWDGQTIVWVDTYAVREPGNCNPVEQGNPLVHVYPRSEQNDEAAINLVVLQDYVCVRDTNTTLLVDETDTEQVDQEAEEYDSGIKDKKDLPLVLAQAHNKYPRDKLRIQLLTKALAVR